MDRTPVIDFRFAPPSIWTCLALQDDPYKTVVREDGALLYDFDNDHFPIFQFKRAFEFSLQAAHGPQSVAQVTETPRFPCVVTTLRYARATLELRAFAHERGGKRTDVVLWKVSAQPDAGEVLTALQVDGFEMSRKFVARSRNPGRVIFAVDAAAKPAADEAFAGSVVLLDDEDESLPAPGEVAFISSPYPLVPTNPTGFRPASALATAPFVLQGGESCSGALIFPLNYSDDAGLDEAWAQRAYAEARQYWQDLTILRLPIHLPDQDLMDMVTACARNILQAREIENGLPVFKVGPTCYRSLFVVDGHFLLEAAMYLGLQEDAYRGVDTLLRRVHPDGSISEMPYHSKETGISLFTMVRQCELMNDDQRLFTLWPVIRDAVGYIEQLREQAYALPVDSPCHGLMPEAYADGGLGGKRGEYTTVFWTLAGLKAAAQTADRLGMADDAVRFHKDFDSLMADFRRHAARDMQRLPDGTPYLPMWKSYSGDHNWIPHYPRQTPAESRLTPASATWALCQAIYPGEVFDAQDELVQNLLHLYDLVDDEEGIPALTGWLPYQSLWNYNASFGAHVWLYAGRPDKALDYLYAFANHASPTRVWREEQSLKATGHGQLFGDMPHNWASAEFIRLVRHLVVFERGDDLELLPGVPAAWRKPGDVIHFGDTPTRFGPVSLRLETGDRDAFTLDIGLDLTYPIRPRTIKVKLQSREVNVNGQSIDVDPEGWAQLPVEQAIHLVGVWQH